MKLSNKKSNDLYASVHNSIMDARVKINSFLESNYNHDYKLRGSIDDILSDLNFNAPQKAIDVFKETVKRKK